MLPHIAASGSAAHGASKKAGQESAHVEEALRDDAVQESAFDSMLVSEQQARTQSETAHDHEVGKRAEQDGAHKDAPHPKEPDMATPDQKGTAHPPVLVPLSAMGHVRNAPPARTGGPHLNTHDEGVPPGEAAGRRGGQPDPGAWTGIRGMDGASRGLPAGDAARRPGIEGHGEIAGRADILDGWSAGKGSDLGSDGGVPDPSAQLKRNSIGPESPAGGIKGWSARVDARAEVDEAGTLAALNGRQNQNEKIPASDRAATTGPVPGLTIMTASAAVDGAKAHLEQGARAGEVGGDRSKPATADVPATGTVTNGQAASSMTPAGVTALAMGGAAPAGLVQEEAGATATPAGARSIVSTIADGIFVRQGELRATPSSTSFRVVLQPQSLGTVTVQVERTQAGLQVTLTPHRAETQALLDRHLPELASALATGDRSAPRISVVAPGQSPDGSAAHSSGSAAHSDASSGALASGGQGLAGDTGKRPPSDHGHPASGSFAQRDAQGRVGHVASIAGAASIPTTEPGAQGGRMFVPGGDRGGTGLLHIDVHV